MKGFTALPLLIILIIISAVGFSGYNIYQRQQTPKASSSNNQNTPTPKISTSSTFTSTPKPTTTQATKPKLTPTPTNSPDFKNNPWATPTTSIDMNTQSNIKLESVSPNPAINNQQIILKGSNFGSSSGYVVFYNINGQVSGSPQIDKWTDSEIDTRVTFVAGGSFYLEVRTASEQRSNKIPFTVSAGQPYFVKANVSPLTFKKGSTITVSGKEFGSSVGKVNFYKGYGNLIGYGVIGSWNDIKIIFTVPPSLETSEYGVQIVTSDNRESQYQYFNVTD